MIIPIRVWREFSKWFALLACLALILAWISSQLTVSRIQLGTSHWIRLYAGLIEVARRDAAAAMHWSGFVDSAEWHAVGFSLPRLTFLPQDSGWRLVIPIWIPLLVAMPVTAFLFIRDSRRIFPGRCCRCARLTSSYKSSPICRCGLASNRNPNPPVGKQTMALARRRRRIRFAKWSATAALVAMGIPYLLSGWVFGKYRKATQHATWDVHFQAGSIGMSERRVTGPGMSLTSAIPEGFALAFSRDWTPHFRFRPVVDSSNTTSSFFQTRRIIVSVWPVIVVLTVLAAACWWLDRRKPQAAGSCSQCGYNLFGNTSGACPECGWSVPSRDFPKAPGAPPESQS